MLDKNCYTFDASTGILTPQIQLEKHLTLQVGVEENNHEKKKIRACLHNPPRNICQQSLKMKSGGLEGGKIVHSEKPKGVLFHIVNSHKIKPLKDSHRDVTIHGSRTALVKISKGHGVIVHNTESKWHIYVDRQNMPIVASATVKAE